MFFFVDKLFFAAYYVLFILEYEDETLAQLEKMEPLPSSQSQASGTGSSIDSSQQPSSVHMPVFIY